jgi:HK97 family phage major capsid protein
MAEILEQIQAALEERDSVVQKTITKALADIAALREKSDAHGVNLIDLAQKLAGASGEWRGSSGGGTSRDTLSSIITKAMEGGEIEAFRNKGTSHLRLALGDVMTKAVAPIYEGTDPNQFPIMPDRRPGIVAPGAAPLRIRSLLPTVRTTSGIVEYVREKAAQLNADYQLTEGALKPQSDLSFELDQRAVVTIAHWMLASVQVLADSAGLTAYLQQRLLFGLKLKEDAELLVGDGTQGKLSGLLLNSTAFPGGDGTSIDAIRAAVTTLSLSGYTPTGCIVNPLDAEQIDLAKTATGEYLTGGPSTSSGSLWQVPLVQSTSMPQGQFLIADFGAGTTLFDNQQANVLFSREDADNLRRNMVTVLAEERLCLIVWDKAALVSGPFAAPPPGGETARSKASKS